MENKNNIIWDVNLNYITKDDLKTIYGFIPDADQTTTDNNKTDLTIMAIAISSERINTITGNKIESIGFNNFNDTQQKLIKRATAVMTIYYLNNGMSFIRASVSISGNGLASSISPPAEPDYILNQVYDLLQQASLHIPIRAISNNVKCGYNNFNTPSIYDESDRKTISWDSANKTFLQLQSLVEGTGIKLENVSGTIPKIKIINTGASGDNKLDKPINTKESINQLIKDLRLTPNFYVAINEGEDEDKWYLSPNPTIFAKILNDLANSVIVNNLNTNNKTIVGAINEIYDDINKKQDKLTAGNGIDINNNIISVAPVWKQVGTYSKWQVEYNFIQNKNYRVKFNLNVESNDLTSSRLIIEFEYKSNNEEVIIFSQPFDSTEGANGTLYLKVTPTKIFIDGNVPETNFGVISELQESIYKNDF